MGSLDVDKLNKTVPKNEFVIHHIWSMEACMRRFVALAPHPLCPPAGLMVPDSLFVSSLISPSRRQPACLRECDVCVWSGCKTGGRRTFAVRIALDKIIRRLGARARSLPLCGSVRSGGAWNACCDLSFNTLFLLCVTRVCPP